MTEPMIDNTWTLETASKFVKFGGVVYYVHAHKRKKLPPVTQVFTHVLLIDVHGKLELDITSLQFDDYLTKHEASF